MTDLLMQFKDLPNDIKRKILRKYQKITHDENKRLVRCIQWRPLGMNLSMFECDGIKCLVNYNYIECGVVKEHGIGLRYGILIDENVFNTICPSSRDFTCEELKRITRALCNILHFVARRTHPQDELTAMIKPKAQEIINKLVDFSNQRTLLTTIAPRFRVSMRETPTLNADLNKIVWSMFAPKKVMMWT